MLFFSAESTSIESSFVRFTSSLRASNTQFSLLKLTRRYSKTAVVPLFVGNDPKVVIQKSECYISSITLIKV